MVSAPLRCSKEDRATTKVSVVYDGAANYQNKSLNVEMLTGPKLQQDIVDILVMFRRGAFAIVGDIREMFSQIVLREEDRRFHRILWRDLDADSPIKVYEASRLPFGDRASPFLAQFTIRTNAERNQDAYPLAAESCLQFIYIDDVMRSLDTVPQIIQLCRELTAMLHEAEWDIRKFISNSVEALQDIPPEDRAPNIVNLEESELPSVKALGIKWDAGKDVFGYSYTLPELEVVSKRTLLSLMARLFDPLQLLAPFVIRAKILLQHAWIEGLGWDEEFPEALDKQVRVWAEELPLVVRYELPRCLKSTESTPERMEIHTFADASSLAYAAAIYLRCLYSDVSVTVRIALAAAKARVAPLKAISIPRLELILRLAVKTQKLLGVTTLHFWTDSMDVVHWIHGQSRRYKPFVSHRVAEIPEKSSPQQWRHVPGEQNPADLGTRGSSLENLIEESFWTEGPAFLQLEENRWPAERRLDPDSDGLSDLAQEEVSKSNHHLM
ncbi:uncharacterized protein LOC135491110 [Lineus longissimus]|uniref:uncharacterized protein LOC135491110 n=1 Tax=Lineus longissimus TaxID=88925 RepID=UPI00315C7D86